MPQRSYVTLDEVETIVTQQVPEGVNLEYKGSDILINRDANKVCKTVSALANSVGGIFVIGIEVKDEVVVRVDDGTPSPSKRDWIYQAINGGTFPAVETVEIREFCKPTGTIYVIEVTPSPNAPHQSKDHKYYKRRGSHSEVMEHYEIEDIRNRPKRALNPLRAELQTQHRLAYLRLANIHETDVISDLRCEIQANFQFDRRGLTLLETRGLHALMPRSELHFQLGSMVEILQEPEARITFSFRYTYHETAMSQSVTFYLSDLLNTAIIESPIERELKNLGNKIDKISGQLDKLHHSAKALTSGVDGTGFRLSQRTLRTLKELPQRFNPWEFDADGYCIIADISMDDAYALNRLFSFPLAQAKEQYESIDATVRAKFEKYFEVKFSDMDS
jgi:hypothetical protein